MDFEDQLSLPHEEYDADMGDLESGSQQFFESEGDVVDFVSDPELLSDSDEDEMTYTKTDDDDVPNTPEARINRQEQLRMLHFRRYLDKLNEKVLEKDYIVQKTRQELKKCRERIQHLELERDQVFAAIQGAESQDNVSAAYRLRAQHDRVIIEREDEVALEQDIKKTLDTAEYELAQAQVEQGKFLADDEELKKKEASLLREKTEMARMRDRKEQRFAAQADRRRKAREREHVEAIRERERRQRQAMIEAKKSKEKASKYLQETMEKIRQRQTEEEEKSKSDLEHRMQTLLSLKSNIASNRENLRALQARDRAIDRANKEALDDHRQAVLAEGGNPEQALLYKQRVEEFEKEKQLFAVKQRERQMEIAGRILREEQRMKKRMTQQPQLWSDPKREEAKRVAPHKKRKLRIFQDSGSSSLEYSADAEDENKSSGDHIDAGSSDEEASRSRSVYGTTSRIEFPDSDSDSEVNNNLSKPEFEGMWDRHKPYRVPKDTVDPIIKAPGASKMDQDIMQKVLSKHREGIVVKQVAAGREFKGCPFYSKPDVIHFKDLEVGKTYKKKVILTNVSYSVNYCKLVGITEHLKDFIEILFDPPGQMSAGMTCEMLVTFKPMINEDLEGEVSFLAQTGPFSIPLKITTKKCDLSVDTRVVDFGTTVIGETLKRYITLTNNGALGTQYEFVKITGLKPRTLTTAETSIGRLTTAETVPAASPDSEAGDKKKAVVKQLEKTGEQDQEQTEDSTNKPPSDETGDAVKIEGEKVEEDDGLQDSGLEDESGEVASEVEFPSEAEDFSTVDGLRVGSQAVGEIKPFSSVKLEIVWNPTIPGHVDTEFNISFTDPLSQNISCKSLGNAIDVPVWLERQSVDLKICMYDRLYQDTVIANNRATTALRLVFEVPKELKNHLEILPKTGYVQAQSQFSAQLKFLPRQGLSEDAAKYFDKETGILEAPMMIRVAEQTNPVPFTVTAVVTVSDLEFDITSIDFGYCTIYESVKTTVRLTNKSILPQEFGFVGIPEYVDVQPNDGFGTLLPLETIELDIIFSPPKARNYNFELTCKSKINRVFKISCKGVGVHPPLELDSQIIHFAATALNDVSTASFHVINSHTSMNEYTHPVPRIGKGEIAPVGPTSFEFIIPEGAPLTISPAVGTVNPGQKSNIRLRFHPTLPDPKIRVEAVRMSVKLLEAKAEKEYQEALLKEKEEAAQNMVLQKGPGGKKKPAAKSKASPKGKKGGAQPTDQGPIVKGPAPVKAPAPESIDPKSDAYAQATASLLRTYNSEFSSYVIPCYVASGKTGNPGELNYSIHNTLYLEVHCPTVKPKLVVISDNGRTTVDFGEVSIGQTVIKTATIQNISDEMVSVKSSLLDPVGPFQLLNALRELEPDETLTLILNFTPTAGRVFQEFIELCTQTSTLYMTLTGQGVSPKVNLSLDENMLDMGAVLVNEYREETFKITNTSSLAIDYSIKLDSNSLLRHARSQGLPQFIKPDPKLSALVGTQNNNGKSVFDCVPCEGSIAPGNSKEITMTFAPDHASDYYSDGVRIELFGMEEQHVFPVKGVCHEHIMYVTGGDTLTPDVESLAVLPVLDDDDDGKSHPKPILLTFESISKENEFTVATRELLIGCVRTMAVSQKKNGEFSFENTKDIELKGFTIDQQKGQVEAGVKRSVIFSWTPPVGHDPNRPLDASILVTVKGDVTEQYKIMLKAFVVSE